MKKLVEKHLITNITDTTLLNRSFSRVDTVSMGHCSLFLKTIWTFLKWFYFYLLSIFNFFHAPNTILWVQFLVLQYNFSFSFLSCTAQVKKKVNYCDRCTALTTQSAVCEAGAILNAPQWDLVDSNLQPSKPKCTSLTTRPPHWFTAKLNLSYEPIEVNNVTTVRCSNQYPLT